MALDMKVDRRPCLNTPTYMGTGEDMSDFDRYFNSLVTLALGMDQLILSLDRESTEKSEQPDMGPLHMSTWKRWWLLTFCLKIHTVSFSHKKSNEILIYATT